MDERFTRHMSGSPQPSEASSDFEQDAGEGLLDKLEEELKAGKWLLKEDSNEDEVSRQAARQSYKTSFLSTYSGAIDRQYIPPGADVYSGVNIIHILARSNESKIQLRKLIVYAVVERCFKQGGDCWKLLTDPDPDGQTGLERAIRKKNHRFVKYLVDAWITHSEKKGVQIDHLFNAGTNGNNCLHSAITYMTPIPEDKMRLQPKKSGWREAIELMINHASAEILGAANDNGLTPLHLAVKGEKCTPQQLVIVEELVKKCDAALDVKKEGTTLSPYQYHLKTYEEHRNHHVQWETDRKAGQGVSKHQDVDTKSSSRGIDGANAPPKARVDNSGAPTWQKPRNDTDATGMGHTHRIPEGPSSILVLKPSEDKVGHKTSLSGRIGQEKRVGKLERQLTENDDSTIKDTDATWQHQRQQETLNSSMANATNTVSQNDKKARGCSKGHGVTDSSVSAIRWHLKLAYLRNRSRRKALDFLYGGVSDMQLDFNLCGKTGLISEDDFKLGYGCAKFEPILQSVHIPDLAIDPTQSSASPDSETGDITERQTKMHASQSFVEGREDLKIIFNWLYDTGKVRKILKLHVDDSSNPPHKDEAIETALYRFDVEIWNWVKVDICGDMIAKVAPNARHVTLYWSGKNVVLQGWSDSESGLASLARLQQLDVHLRSGVEGSARNTKNFKSFVDRLARRRKEKSRGAVDVELFDRENHLVAGSVPRVKKEESIQNHRWIECMEGFSKFIRAFPVRKLRASLKPIKIAIIDDGIDTTEKRLHGRVVGGQYFCIDDEESLSFCVSTHGHGTMMAQQVTRVFPKAEIISLKLGEYYQHDGSSTFCVKSAADAVRYACQQGASIINMSWSIEDTGDKAKLEDLRNAVEEAQRKDVLMFCSASDQGKNDDTSLPGQWRTANGNLLRIGAATALGREYHYVSFEHVDFLLPGRVVEKEQDDEMADNVAGVRVINRSVEGSSLATAFASGLAGLILYVTQILSCYHQEETSALREDLAGAYDNIKGKPHHMRTILNRLTTNNKKFVDVQKVFENAEDRMKGISGPSLEGRVEVLSNIHSKLLSGLDM